MRIKVDENGNWRSFRHRNFRILYPANALSNIGTWAQRVAQDWLVLELTNNNGAYLGLVTAIQFAPKAAPTTHVQMILDSAPAAIATTPAASQQLVPIAIRVTTAFILEPCLFDAMGKE